MVPAFKEEEASLAIVVLSCDGNIDKMKLDCEEVNGGETDFSLNDFGPFKVGYLNYK